MSFLSTWLIVSCWSCSVSRSCALKLIRLHLNTMRRTCMMVFMCLCACLVIAGRWSFTPVCSCCCWFSVDCTLPPWMDLLHLWDSLLSCPSSLGECQCSAAQINTNTKSLLSVWIPWVGSFCFRGLKVLRGFKVSKSMEIQLRWKIYFRKQLRKRSLNKIN